jgi:HD-GYP domain-containing protein (c-di-GMP phosphodiesterase class II)
LSRILLIGPERERAVGLRSLLRQHGHTVIWSRSVSTWREQEREQRPDLVLAAVRSAADVFAVAGRPPSGFPPPILVVQQESDFHRDVHLDERLVDRLASPFLETDLVGRVDALVNVRRIVGGAGATSRAAAAVRPGITGKLLSLMGARPPAAPQPVGPSLEVVARLANWSDRRDAFRPGHAERVTSFSAMIAEGLGFAEQETSDLLRAAMLHDVGKVVMPLEVLRRRGPLDPPERELIRTHPSRGAALLRALDSDDKVARVVLYHHERPDGSGYYGKVAGSVPRAAWALAVAEAFDAMTSSLVAEPLTAEYALGKLQSRKGADYDAGAVEALADQLQPRAACIPLSGPAPGPRC